MNETEINIQVYIRQFNSGPIQFSETVNMGSHDFREIAAIFARIHDLFQEIKKEFLVKP